LDIVAAYRASLINTDSFSCKLNLQGEVIIHLHLKSHLHFTAEPILARPHTHTHTHTHSRG